MKRKTVQLTLVGVAAFCFLLIQLRVIDLTGVFRSVGVEEHWGEAGILLLLCLAGVLVARRYP